jgi:hypothetical protein
MVSKRWAVTETIVWMICKDVPLHSRQNDVREAVNSWRNDLRLLFATPHSRLSRCSEVNNYFNMEEQIGFMSSSRNDSHRAHWWLTELPWLFERWIVQLPILVAEETRTTTDDTVSMTVALSNSSRQLISSNEDNLNSQAVTLSTLSNRSVGSNSITAACVDKHQNYRYQNYFIFVPLVLLL